MKRTLFLNILVLVCIYSFSQSSDKNHITTTVATREVSEATNLSDLNSNTVIQYFDGLGRPIQTVLRGVSGETGSDLATFTEYDGAGREYRHWLPIVGNGQGAFVELSNFTGTNTVKTNYYGSNIKPYAETVLEASPLGRVEGQKKAGDAWHLKPSAISYGSNTVSEVRYFYVNNNEQLVRNATTPQFYEANSLYKTTYTDEDGKISVEFKDKIGQVVMTRSGTDYDTYYIYNDLGKLSYVLSPEASDKLAGLNTALSMPEKAVDANTANTKALWQLAYHYRYDERGNCSYKKLPGCEPIYMVYDKADRLVLSQDGNQRINSEWTFTKYDALGRVIQTGVLSNEASAATLVTTYKTDLITENYDYQTHAYTNIKTMGTNAVILTQNYYDSYDFLTNASNTFSGCDLTYQDKTTDGFDSEYSPSAKGLLTGTSVGMLDGSSRTVTALYYDARGRVVQSRANNRLDGYDYEYLHYKFTGLVEKKQHVHKSKYNAAELTENYRFTYDLAQRPTGVYHKINTAAEKTLATMSYNELGQLKQKILNGGGQTIDYSYNIQGWLKSISSPAFSETVYYEEALDGKPTYYNGNISSVKWGKGTNQNEKYYYTYDAHNRMLKAQYAPDDLYNEEIIQYDKNGNVKRLTRNGYLHDIDKEWPVYPGMIDDIGMVYEGNQLKNAWENLNDQELANVSTNDFRDVYEENRTVKYLYDANGNQFADFNKGIAWIKYNLLNLPQTIQFANGNKTEYMYDAAGIKQSARWSYSTTEANIQLGDVANENNSIGTTSTTDYCGAYVYEQGKLRRILTPEGYVSANGVITPNAIAYWQHVYLLTDHLGNTRKIMLSNYLSSTSVALTERPQAIDYYPFGMEITKVDNVDSETYSPGYMGGFVTPYLYNGKEMDRMHGLNSYDHGARWRDGVIPAWPAVDPKCEYGYNISPYSYCHNNPILYVDPDGMWDRIAGGYTTSDQGDINRFMSYFQSEEAVGKKKPNINQSLSFIDSEENGSKFNLSDGSYFISEIIATKSSKTNNWKVDKESFNNAWKDVDEIRSGGNNGGGDFFNRMNNFADNVGFFADFAKEAGALGSIGIWRDLSNIRFYPKGWSTGNGTVKTIGTATTLGYGMYGLSLVANAGLYLTNQQSGLTTSVNIGINTIMLRMPLPVMVGSQLGGVVFDIQQNAFDLFIRNGHGDSKELYNVTW